MDKLKVDANTLAELSEKVKIENEKLKDIVSKISQLTVNNEEMLISDAGELFKTFMIGQQEKEIEEIENNNILIAEKLLTFSNIYDNTNEEIGGLVK